MAAFTRPFDPGVTREPELTLTLPDPARLPNQPLIRPGVARYAGKTLVLLRVTAGSPFGLRSPAAAAARAIELDAPVLPGVDRLLEISPLPFGIAPVLRALRPGLPTFYLGAASMAFPEDDDRVANEALALAADVVVGAIFQDGVTLAPWSWIEMLRTAMEATGDTDGANEWGTLLDLYTGVRSLRVLDHAGQVLTGATFDVRIRLADASFEGPFSLATGSSGDLELAAIASPLPRAGGPQPSLFGAPDEQTELRWTSSAPLEGTPHLVHAVYETGLSAPPSEGVILLPAGTERAHLQALEVAKWFAPFRPGISLARFRENSRVEPLIDGVATFARMLDDLRAAAAPGCGGHFAGLKIKDLAFDLRSPDETSLIRLTERIVENGGGALFLPHKWVNINESIDDAAIKVAVVAVFLLRDLLLYPSALGLTKTSTAGFFVVLGGTIIATAAIIALLSLTDLVEDKLEESRETLEALNAIRNNSALFAFYPVRFRDNPIYVPLPFDLERYVDKIGSGHQKLQLIKRPTAGDGPNEFDFVAYLGGVDLNPNRMDTPGHHGVRNYHDVHARVTGPGAADVFLTWQQRWDFHRADPAHPVVGDIPEPAFTPPDPSTLGEPGRHIVQVGRTYHQTHPDDRPGPFEAFAPEGDTSIYDSMRRAIAAAREYIYVEDQYFTPDDVYFDALVAAAAVCQRLVILVPADMDQIFGDRRRQFLFNRLRDAWGDRVFVGTPLRRPLLSDPGRLASEGRCYVMQPIGLPSIAGTDSIVLGPAARVPDNFPYWIWIDGELMLTAGLPYPTTVLGQPCKGVDVLRGPAGSGPRWGATPRAHQQFAPATMSQVKGIFVHAKVTMIDDVFVTIGSANINRRGFFHDAELNVFAVPEELRASTDNPARALRTALWAEQLGIAPAMGPALLGDPIAAYELFRRSHLGGNRLAPFESFYLRPDLTVSPGESLIQTVLLATIIGWGADHVSLIWNDLADPTTRTEETSIPGPVID